MPRSYACNSETLAVHANAEGRIVLSADELAKGLIVHAPSTRWAALLVEPYQPGKDYGTPVMPETVQAVMAERTPTLEATLKRSVSYNQ